ncbi:MAG: hypothetical protein AB1652_06265 [Bacillota bacterium]
MLAVLLFICIFILLLALTLPGEYVPAPAALALEGVRDRLNAYLLRGDRGQLYVVTGQTAQYVLKIGLIVGGALGFVVLVAAVKFIGLLALIPAVALVAVGILVADLVFTNEYRRWQARLFDGIPVFVNFMPSFLETGVITPRQAMGLTIPFLPEPLRSEFSRVVDRAARTGKTKDALADFADRAKHPVVDAITFRLGAMWDARITPDVFADLGDQIRDMTELVAARATAAKGGLLALVCVIGLLGALPIFGWPAWKWLAGTMGGMFN